MSDDLTMNQKTHSGTVVNSSVVKVDSELSPFVVCKLSSGLSIAKLEASINTINEIANVHVAFLRNQWFF